jgi:dTDP-4-amino-4,6-dideoxygalactose transaminase
VTTDDRTRQRIIGGMFGFEEMPSPSCSSPPFLQDQDILLADARSGISLVVELLSPARVWVPSYLCWSVLAPIPKSKVRFYEVGHDLEITSQAWLTRAQRGDLILLIDYFGFPCDASCALAARERGAWVLEDASQALLSEGCGQVGDFVVFSPRKFVGVPDGGILTVNCDVSCDGVRFESPPADWWLRALSACILRKEFDVYGGDRRWYELSRRTNAEGPIGHYAMSELSRTLLHQGFDYAQIIRRRVRNYQLLADLLGDIALFPELPSGVVPLGFPIRVCNRDDVRQALFEHQVYPPVHWSVEKIVPDCFADSHRLSAEIMTLPCDQRYDDGDMDRMARLVRVVLERYPSVLT